MNVHTDRLDAALPPDPAASSEAAGGADIRDFLAMLYRHRWSALLVLVVVSAAGIIRTLRETPEFTCTPALLEITSDNSGIATLADVLERQYIGEDYIETQIHLIRSESVLKEAYESPACAPVRAKMDLGDFSGGVTVVPVRASYLVQVLFQSPWPELNPVAANAVAHAYVTVGRRSKEARTNRASTEFEKRREEVRGSLEKAEKDIAAFRTAHQVADVRAEKQKVDAQVASLESEIDRLNLQFVGLEQSLREVQEAKKTDSLDRVGRVLQDQGFLDVERSLRLAEEDRYALREFKDDSEKVQAVTARIGELKARRAVVIASIVSRIESEHAVTRDSMERLKESIVERRKEQKLLTGLLIDLTNLEEERDRLRTDLDGLVQQASQVQATRGFDLAPAIVQQEARLSPVQVKPRVSRDILVAILLGIALAVGVSFLLEQFNDAVTRPEEISRVSGLPILGMMPRIPGNIPDGVITAMADPSSEMAEAVRIIRTGILFTPSGTAERRRILVTSAESGEGKTLLSSNLAVALAQTGQKTLIVDCDLRKPRIHRVFGIPNEKGLTHIFANGQVRVPPTLVGEGETALSVLPSGPIPPNPAELLGGDRITRFFDEESAEYRRIVIDSPPAGPVSDPALLARQVDGVILVVRLGKTSIRAIRRAVDHLHKVGAPLLGVVINGASMGGGYYYYYYYRRYGYYGYDAGSKVRGKGSPSEG